jgi:DNA polymerase (family 10)
MPIHNEDIAAIFDELADLLEIEDANPFRVWAYRNAARTVRGHGREMAELVAEDFDLTTLPSIGKDLAAKIKEILTTGKAAALDKLHKEVPASLEELLKVPGLGPKRVKILYHTLGIQTLEELEKAARDGRIRELDGFGSKTEQHILEILAAHRQLPQRFLRGAVGRTAEALTRTLKQVPAVQDVIIAGSYRRGRETVGDLDILVTATTPGPVMDCFTGYDEVSEVVSKGPTRSTVILRSGLQVDLRLVTKESLGAALHYFTGSKAHNILIRRLGQQRGLKINEYGVFRGNDRVAGETEESVFHAVGLPFIPPELRENQGEVEVAREKRLPRLVEFKDLQGDLHAHTSATDGRAGLREMALAAKARGLKYLAITDHSQRLTVARGLNPQRLSEQMETIDHLNAEIKGFTLLKGIEVDILEDGSLDLPDSVLEKLDLVVGAVHSHFNLPRDKQTDRILRAMDHRHFSILAHPSGRLLSEREPYDVDMARIIEKVRERGCFLELNSQPERLDLTDTWCRIARDEGVLISVNSDAHSEDGLDSLHFGVLQARRGWLEKGNVLNTRPLAEIRRLLKQTMQ